MNRNRRLYAASMIAMLVGSVAAREFRAPLVSELGPRRYEMEPRNEGLTYNSWSMTYGRTADRCFTKHGTKTRSLPTLIFDKENFTVAEAFGKADDLANPANICSSNQNVNIHSTRLYPCGTYTENGYAIGGRLDYPVCNNRGRIGVRAHIPFRTVRFERDNDAERAEAGSSEVNAITLDQYTNFVTGNGEVFVQNPFNTGNQANVISPNAFRVSAMKFAFPTADGGVQQFIRTNNNNLVVGNREYDQADLTAQRERPNPYVFVKVPECELPADFGVPVQVQLDRLQTGVKTFGPAPGANPSPVARLVQGAGNTKMMVTDGAYTEVNVANNNAFFTEVAANPRFTDAVLDGTNPPGVETFAHTLNGEYRALGQGGVDRIAAGIPIAQRLAVDSTNANPGQRDLPQNAAGVLAAAVFDTSQATRIQQLPTDLNAMQEGVLYLPTAGQGNLARSLAARTDVWAVEIRDNENRPVDGATTTRLQRAIDRYGELSAEQWLKACSSTGQCGEAITDPCNVEIKSNQRTGVGDIDLNVFYEHTFDDEWRAEGRIGVRLPTGSDSDKCYNPYKAKLGNGDHFEVSLGGNVAWNPKECMTLRLDAQYALVLKAEEYITAPLKCAQVKAIGRCVKADVSWNHFTGRVDLQMYHPKTDRLVTTMGYELYYKTQDNVDLKACTTDLSCFFGTACNTADRAKIREASLDRKVAERNTERIAHRVYGETNFRLNKFFDIYMGGSFTFAGKNMPKESDYYFGTSVRF